jgi:UDP-N-acetylmuramoyl-tripeptide--D-alanyl-D-alanine ligase
MQPCTLKELATRCGGAICQGDPQARILRVDTDSRTAQGGDCFFALPPLPGYRLDGHDFVVDASGKGAVAAVVSHLPNKMPAPGFGLVVVKDTYVALQRLAADYRKRMPAQIVGVTGSNGKTSAKEMIASVLRQHYRTHATEGNFNTQAGVPLTLLGLMIEHEVAVIEMGISHPGEMARLAGAASPDIGVITQIGTAHVEFLGDQAGVAREKSDLIAALPDNGFAVLNADDPWSEKIRSRTRANVVLAGLSGKADWRAENVNLTERGIQFNLLHDEESVPIELPVFGRVMVNNALLAAAVGGCLDLSMDEIKTGLETAPMPQGRMQVLSLAGGRWLMNDAHNANRDSMLAALQTLNDFPAKGRKFAVLGSMGELGDHAEKIHLEIGAAAAQLKLEHLVVMGPLAEFLERGAREGGFAAMKMTRCGDHVEALAAIKGHFTQPGDCLLVKGSFMRKLEILVHALGGPKPPHIPD